MANCLGIYASEHLIKYAKLSMDKDKKVTLQQYGTKFILSNKLDTIRNIIAETKSEEDKIVVSTANEAYVKISPLKTLSRKDLVDAIRLDFEEWCEAKAVLPENYEYTYLFADVPSGDYFNGYLNIVAKNEIETLKKLPNAVTSAMYPANFTIPRLVPKEDSNYILVNLDEKIYVTTVIDNKTIDITVIEDGMKVILDKFTEILGSYQRAYEGCRSINVFSEGENINNRDLESIVEPALQDILKHLSEIVKKYKQQVTKIFITGIATLFTNIDILFREYFELKTEILKSDFMNDISNVRNVAEALESSQPMAVAYEYLNPIMPVGIEYIKKTEKKSIFDRFKNFDIKKVFKKDKDIKKQSDEKVAKPKIAKPLINVQNLQNYDNPTATLVVVSLAIFTGLLFTTYIVFGQVYTTQINKIKADYTQEITRLETETAKINTDIDYIDTNTTKYKDINEDVTKTVEMIESNQIGKNSTYNVAAFLQKIITIIPKNVQLITLASGDNKNVTLEVQSTQYASLGYLVAQLKLVGVLNNVTILSITNGTNISVKIGGDLP